MRTINPYSHIPDLYSKFMDLLPVGSFGSKLWRQIGSTIDDMFVDEVDAYVARQRMSKLSPASSLFYWLHRGGRIDIDWLMREDGAFYDDKGNPIPEIIEISISPVQHLAAYGLWLIEEDAHCCGPSAEEDWNENRINPYGWTEVQVLHHKAECMLVAYHVLSYAARLSARDQLTSEERKAAVEIDYSAMGKKGAERRHATMNELKEWTIAQYRAGTWKEKNESANKAASDLKACVLKHSASIRANMMEHSAQNTIAGWIRKSV